MLVWQIEGWSHDEGDNHGPEAVWGRGLIEKFDGASEALKLLLTTSRTEELTLDFRRY